MSPVPPKRSPAEGCRQSPIAALRHRVVARRAARRLHECSVELEMPFHDVDPLGVVWHGHYYRYLELARTRLLRCRGLDAGDLIGPRFRFVVIESACRHTAPLRYGDRVRITAWLRDVAHRIFVAYEVTDLGRGRRVGGLTRSSRPPISDGKMLLQTPREILERLGPEPPETVRTVTR